MKTVTRYGKAEQKKCVGVIPAMVVAIVTGVSTYFIYRYANMKGFKCGYGVGTPDAHDCQQIINQVAAGMTAEEIAKDLK